MGAQTTHINEYKDKLVLLTLNATDFLKKFLMLTVFYFSMLGDSASLLMRFRSEGALNTLTIPLSDD